MSLNNPGYFFKLKIIRPNFDTFYDELENKVTQKNRGVDLNILIALLNQQYENRENYLKDPFLHEAQVWMSRTKQLIAKVAHDAAQRFSDAILKYEKVKSRPINKMGELDIASNALIREILGAKDYLALSDEKIKEVRMEKAYEGGDSYAFLIDVISIIKQATKEVFIIDPYIDDDTFDLFVSKLKNKTEIKILIGLNSKLNIKIVSAFKASNPTINFSMKKSGEIHDRIIFADNRCWIMGQSIKNAAETKPTYIIEIMDVSTMKKIYDDIWGRAVSV